MEAGTPGQAGCGAQGVLVGFAKTGFGAFAFKHAGTADQTGDRAIDGLPAGCLAFAVRDVIGNTKIIFIFTFCLPESVFFVFLITFTKCFIEHAALRWHALVRCYI